MINKNNILFLGVGFRNYDNYIQRELQKRFNVYYINTKDMEIMFPFFFVILYHLHLRWLFALIASLHIQKQLQNLKGVDFEVVFVIKGEYLSASNIHFLKDHFPKAKYILYLWDAWIKHKNRDILIANFKSIFTFDVLDSKKYNFKLRPLFYVKPKEFNNGNGKSYVLSFVGGNHSDRLNKLKYLKKQCDKEGISYRFLLTIGIYDLVKHKYFIRDYNEIKDIISTKQISYDEYLSITNDSIAVVDFPDPLQTGLTIRTIEALAMGKKVITTNEFIVHYKDLPFKNIFVIDPSTINMDSIMDFLNHFNEEPLNDKFSLKSFIDDIIK